MIDIQKDLRPNCNGILSNNSWALSLDELKNTTELQEFDDYFQETKSMNESFHKFFILTKLRLDQTY
jgi:hypothetical protein